jgi:hypothetical protein
VSQGSSGSSQQPTPPHSPQLSSSDSIEPEFADPEPTVAVYVPTGLSTPEEVLELRGFLIDADPSAEDFQWIVRSLQNYDRAWDLLHNYPVEEAEFTTVQLQRQGRLLERQTG